MIALRRRVPARVLDEGPVRAQVERHGPAAPGTAGHERGRDAHVLLHGEHRADLRLVVVRFLMTWLRALKEPVIPLRIEQPLLIKPRDLKAVIDVGRQHEVVFSSHQSEQVLVRLARGLVVTVDIDIARPVRPELLERRKGIKPARVHIVKAILLLEIVKILLKALAPVSKPRGRGEPRARADEHGVRLLQLPFDAFDLCLFVHMPLHVVITFITT